MSIFNILRDLLVWAELKLDLGRAFLPVFDRFLVRVFHYLALFAIGSAIVWSAFFAFLEMAKKTSASIEDILLLFIYLELGAVVGIYFKKR